MTYYACSNFLTYMEQYVHSKQYGESSIESEERKQEEHFSSLFLLVTQTQTIMHSSCLFFLLRCPTLTLP